MFVEAYWLPRIHCQGIYPRSQTPTLTPTLEQLTTPLFYLVDPPPPNPFLPGSPPLHAGRVL